MEHKKNSKILIIILAVIVIGAGGIYGYVSQRQKADKTEVPSKAEDAEITIDDIYGDDTEDAMSAEEEDKIQAEKSAEEAKKETEVSQESDPINLNNQTIVQGKNNFEIKQLNVNGHYNGSHSVNYSISRNGLVFDINFYSSDLSKDNVDKALVTYKRIPKGGTYKYGVSIEQYHQETLATIKNNPNTLPAVRKIGEYYYVFVNSQTSLSGKDAEVQLNVAKGLQNHFQTLVEI